MMKTVTGLAPLAVSGRLERLRARLASSSSTRCSSPGCPTCATSPASPDPRRCCSCSPTARCSCPTAATASRRARRSHEAGVDVAVEIRTTMARAARGARVGGTRRRERIGLEDHGVSWAQQRELAEAFGGAELVPAGAVVEELRRVKDDGEVDRIAAACAIADDAFAAMLPRLAEGPTEREFALALEFAMRERGASHMSFDPDHRGRAERRDAALASHRPADRPRRARRVRLRLRRRGLLLRHDPHRQRR